MRKLISLILTMTLAMTMVIPAGTAFGAENQAESAARTSEEMSISGNDGTGNLVAQALQSKQSEQEANNGCNIYSVEMTGKEAEVSFDTIKDCTLLVAVYDEAGKRMIASGKKEIKAGETQAEIAIDTASMPKYFYLRAFLINTETLEPLAPAYESPNYTREMVEFLGKTINDFDKEQVVNFDNSKSNNFAVYDEDTKVIESDAGKNVVEIADDKSQKYVIENIDQEIASLKAGDIFAYEYEQGITLIVKVKSIKVSGTTATIQGQQTDLEEVFSYVKIDTTATAADAEVDNSNLESGITYTGKDNGKMQAQSLTIIDKDETDTKTLNYEINKNVFKGDLSVNLGTRVKVYINTSHTYVELSFETSMSVYLGVKGKKELDFSIGKITFQPIPCINVEVTPTVELNFSGKAEFEGSIRNKYGASYDSKTGFKEIKENPTVTTEINVEADFYIGLRLKPSASIIDENIASMYLDAKGGAQVHAELLFPEKASANSQAKHACSTCLDGDIDFKANLAFGVSILKKNAKKNLYNKTVRLADFYYSVPNREFGWGTCPHIQYRVTVTVKDKSGKALQGATVNKSISSNASGAAVLWLANGKYKISVTKQNYKDAEKAVTVHNSAANVKVVLEKKSDQSQLGLIDGKKVKQVRLSAYGGRSCAAITEDGTLYTWGANFGGILGDGTTKSKTRPVKIMDNVKSVNLDAPAYAIKTDGTLYMWGNAVDSLKPIKIMDGVSDFSSGGRHTMALKTNGDVYMWDRNDQILKKPTKVMSNAKEVQGSENFGSAVTKQGELYVWNWDYKSGKEPVKIMDNVDTIRPFNTGMAASIVAITKDKELCVCDVLSDSDLKLKPNIIMIRDDVENISINYWGGCYVITSDKALYEYVLNHDNSGHISVSNEGKVMDGVEKGKSTAYANAVKKTNGDLYMWTDASWAPGYGKLYTETPKKVLGNVSSFDIESVFELNEVSAAAITKEGLLYMWGSNKNGELGNGTTTSIWKPSKIGTQSSSKSVVSAMSVDDSEETIEETLSAMSQATSISTAVKTKSYSKLYANTIYNFYVMKDKAAKDPLASNNLLYIGQKTASSKGAAAFTYGAREAYADADIFVAATPADDLRYYTPTIKSSTYTYAGKAIKPTISLTVHGKTLKKGRDYTVRYKDNKSVGTATIIIVGIGDYGGTAVKTFKIVPKKATIVSAASPAKKTVQVKWKKTSQTSGYQIYASRSSKFTSYKKVSVKGGTKTSGKISNLTAKKKYYVKVRSYKVVDGNTYYGSWSKVKTVTVK